MSFIVVLYFFTCLNLGRISVFKLPVDDRIMQKAIRRMRSERNGLRDAPVRRYYSNTKVFSNQLEELAHAKSNTLKQ